MPVLAVAGVLIAIWLVVAIIGAVIKGLFLLFMLGLVLLLLTAAWGWARKDSRR